MDEEDKSRKIIEPEENPRSTLADLVSQIHQLQQIVREKEMLMKRNEISNNFKVCTTNEELPLSRSLLPACYKFLNKSICFIQHDSLMQKMTRLEKQVEQEKRLNTNLAAEIESCRRESRLLKESSLATSQDHTKQVNDFTRRITILHEGTLHQFVYF